ncbi:hypothetical protein Tco_0228064 [Tanacetum coccineum]
MYPSPHPSQPQISHSSVPPSHQYQSHMNHQTLFVPQIAYHSPQASTQPMTEFPQIDSSLVVLSQGDDLIACLNKAMAFLIAVASSRFPSTNNQLRTSSNLRNQTTIQDGRVIVQQVQGRQGQNYSCIGYKGNAISSEGNNTGGLAREKEMLAEVQETGQILDEEKLAFLADPGNLDDQAAQTTILNTSTFQTEDLDAYDSDYDDVSNTKALLMANLSNYGSDVISEEKLALKQQIDSLEQNLLNQIKEKESLLQTFTVFKNESKEKENKYIDKEIDLEKKIKGLDNIVYKVGQSAKTVYMLTKPQVFYDDTHKQALGYQNPFYLKKAQRIKSTLYDASVIYGQHVAMPVIDDEETLILEEVSRSKMLAKQNDPMSKEKKVNTTPINYVELNRLPEDFGKRFVPHQELSDEQAFWLQTLHPNTDQFALSPVQIEAPKELPKASLVNTRLKKLKYHLGQFDNVVKKRITPDAITEGEWGFEHAKTIFLNEIIPFLKILKYIFNVFDKDILNEFDSIKKTHVHTKEQSDSLIAKLNLKSVENEDFKAQLQEKVFVITSLKIDLRKLKGKEIVENVAQIPTATTIVLGMFKLDLDHLAHRLIQNREAHIYYLKHTQEQADVLRGIELLIYVRDTCPNAIKLSEKKVVVTPMNKVKKVRIEAPVLNNLHGVPFISETESDTPEVLQHQLPPKELNPGSFTLPCMIVKFNFYAMADLDMSKMAPLGIVENILVKIDKFLFPSDFVIIGNTPTKTTILRIPFLATIHAEIDVFARKFSLGINGDRISFDIMKKDQNFTNPSEIFFMINSGLDNRP